MNESQVYLSALNAAGNAAFDTAFLIIMLSLLAVISHWIAKRIVMKRNRPQASVIKRQPRRHRVVFNGSRLQ